MHFCCELSSSPVAIFSPTHSKLLGNDTVLSGLILLESKRISARAPPPDNECLGHRWSGEQLRFLAMQLIGVGVSVTLLESNACQATELLVLQVLVFYLVRS